MEKLTKSLSVCITNIVSALAYDDDIQMTLAIVFFHYFYLLGDHRVNEHHGLVSMHVLWLREHNRVAKELKEANPTWSTFYDAEKLDEKLFEEARRVVIAEYQHIIYNEWLPIILGNSYMQNNGINTRSSGYSNAYFGEGTTIEQFDPRVTNEFATAAFRFGHSLIPPNFKRFSETRFGSRMSKSEFKMREAFFHPADFREDLRPKFEGSNGKNFKI